MTGSQHKLRAVATSHECHTHWCYDFDSVTDGLMTPTIHLASGSKRESHSEASFCKSGALLFISWKIFLTEYKMFLTDALMTQDLLANITVVLRKCFLQNSMWQNRKGGKMAISLILAKFFPLLSLCFDSLVCDGVSHTVVLQPTCPSPLCCWPLFEPVQL